MTAATRTRASTPSTCSDRPMPGVLVSAADETDR